jgi:hypothetical protein
MTNGTNDIQTRLRELEAKQQAAEERLAQARKQPLTKRFVRIISLEEQVIENYNIIAKLLRD